MKNLRKSLRPRVIHIRDSTGSDNEVYIGRAGKGHDGVFGNPVIKGRNCFMCGKVHRDSGSTLPCYEEWLQIKLEQDADFAQAVGGLRGKTLVCFCKPGPCHGDVLIKYVGE